MKIKNGAKVFIKNKKTGEFLFFLRDNKPDIPNPNRWGMLGGGIEDGELPEEALKREVGEESNIVLTDIKLLGEKNITLIVNEKPTPGKIYFFLAYTDNTLENLTLQEGQKLGYFTLEKMKEMKNVSPSIIEAIDEYEKILL